MLEARPAYPADLAEALTVATGRNIGTLWLMTTPLQLRAFHRGLPALRGLRRIITATMPLARELAQAVERDWGARLDEIFGCTEGGILATRRPAETPVWTPAAGLEFSVDADGGARVQGGHLPRSLALSDRIRMVDSPAGGPTGTFELVGRDEDVVKIAGKRASLGGLAEQALAIAGVRDAIFFVPGSGSVRLAAILVAPGRSLADLRAELARRIDAAFLPRPLVIVETLARDPNGKLPAATLEKMLGARHGIARPARRGRCGARARVVRPGRSSGAARPFSRPADRARRHVARRRGSDARRPRLSPARVPAGEIHRAGCTGVAADVASWRSPSAGRRAL